MDHEGLEKQKEVNEIQEDQFIYLENDLNDRSAKNSSQDQQPIIFNNHMEN